MCDVLRDFPLIDNGGCDNNTWFNGVVSTWLANATDETRTGECGISSFEKRKMMNGDGAFDSGHIPRVVLWLSGSASYENTFSNNAAIIK